MAKLLFKIWSAVSHYNATFALARSLQRRGHEVVYAGVEELRASVEPEGFAFVVHEETGTFNPFLGRHTPPTGSVWSRVKALARFRRPNGRTRTPESAAATFLNVVEEIRPDAILLDAHYTRHALELLRRRLNFAVLSTKVCLDRTPGLPPIQSSLVPDGTLARPSHFGRL